MTAYDGSPSLAHVLATGELSHRPAREPDYHAENEALKVLVQRLTHRPEGVVPQVTRTALDLCRAGSVGISVLERDASGEWVFRWTQLAGQLAPHVGGCLPLAFSPGGVTLERGCPQLFRHPERYFTYFKSAEPAIVEGLVTPLLWEDEPLGTIWIVSHDEDRVFDREDARIMESLAVVTAAAIRAATIQREAESAARVKDLALETGSLGSWSLDLQTLQLESSTRGKANFGRTEHERFTYADVISSIHLDDRRDVLDRVARAIDTHTDYAAEYRVFWPDGSLHWISARGRPVYTEASVPTLIAGNTVEVTEQRRLVEELAAARDRLENRVVERTQALSERTAQLASALEAARLATWSWDVGADDVSWEVKSAGTGPGFRGSRADFLGLLDPRDRPTAAEALEAAAAAEADLSLECRLADESKPTRHILIKGSAVEGSRRIVGVVLDITAQRQAEQTRNEWLRQLITAQEEERRRVARDLHDQLSRHVAELAVGLHTLDVDHLSRSAIDGLQRLVSDFDLDIRRIARDLRPGVLIDLGLTLAVRAYVDEWSQQSGIAADFASHGDDALPGYVETTIYRIVQEALTNVGRHARARRVSIVLQRRTDDFIAIVEDDGMGFDTATRATAGGGRLGLIGMRERAALIGGRCTIESKPGAGTTVLLSVPLHLPEDPEQDKRGTE